MSTRDASRITRNRCVKLWSAAAIVALLVWSASALADGGKNPDVSPADIERTGPPNPAAGEGGRAGNPPATAQPTPPASPQPNPPATADAGAAKQAAGGSAARGKFSPILPPADYAPPSIQIANPQYNYGTVFKGEVVIHEYVVENKGSSQLVLQKVKPSCGCTTHNYTKMIPPGGQGTISLKIDTSRLKAGPQVKTAEVFSNDPATPRVTLTIQGNISSPFTITPEYPRIECVVGTTDPSTTITLHRTVDIPFRLVSVKSPTNKVKTEVKETKPGEDFEIKLTAATTDTKYAYENVIIEMEGGGKTLNQEVPVSIRFKERISLTPRTVYFRRNEIQPLRDTGAPVSKSVTLKSEVPGTDFRFKITNIEITGGDFKATQDTVKEGEEYKINILIEKLPTDASIRSLKGDVIIHTDDPANTKIPLRVLAFI